jgi:hypothetical protein
MYKVENPMDKAMGGMDKAAGTYGSMDKDIPANRDPGPTPGGAINAGMGGAVAGATVGSMMAAEGAVGLAAVGGPVTLGIGAALGIGAYLLS